MARTLVVISEKVDDGTDNFEPGYVVSYHKHDYAPAHLELEYATEEDARTSVPCAIWQEPDDNAAGDVIAVAYI